MHKFSEFYLKRFSAIWTHFVTSRYLFLLCHITDFVIISPYRVSIVPTESRAPSTESRAPAIGSRARNLGSTGIRSSIFYIVNFIAVKALIQNLSQFEPSSY